jgi:hypothetical protein
MQFKDLPTTDSEIDELIKRTREKYKDKKYELINRDFNEFVDCKEIKVNCCPMVYDDDWKQTLSSINTREELEDFISRNISLTFELEGHDKDTNELLVQLIFVEDTDVHTGKNSITIIGKDMDIRNDFRWGT